MLSVTFKPCVLSVIMLNVIMLSVVMLSVMANPPPSTKDSQLPTEILE